MKQRPRVKQRKSELQHDHIYSSVRINAIISV